MPALIPCPSCNAAISAADEIMGKKVRCKKCSTVFTLELPVTPQADEEPEPSPAPAPSAFHQPERLVLPSTFPVRIVSDERSWFDIGFRFGCGFMVAQFVLAVVLFILWALFAGLFVGIGLGLRR